MEGFVTGSLGDSICLKGGNTEMDLFLPVLISRCPFYLGRPMDRCYTSVSGVLRIQENDLMRLYLHLC